MRKAYFGLISLLVLGILAGGSFWLVSKVRRDRLSVMNYAPMNHTVVRRETQTPNGRDVKTYTAEELEKARKEGKLPKGMQQIQPPSAAQANDAAVQRSLRTIEEINRVNALNQRLMEQQQRMNKQNK